MANVLNAVFGIAIAVIVVFTVTLGIKAFFPPPTAPDYRDFCGAEPAKPLLANETYVQPQCEKDQQAAYELYDTARQEYGRVQFFIGIIVGALLLIVTYFVWNWTNIAAGLGTGGIALVIYGFFNGWNATGDPVKFVMLLIVAAVVLLLAWKLNKRFRGASK
ncbi:MAG: hypothetical protein ABIA93_03470 [Candidatus Woesearchaeota archaeon]